MLRYAQHDNQRNFSRCHTVSTRGLEKAPAPDSIRGGGLNGWNGLNDLNFPSLVPRHSSLLYVIRLRRAASCGNGASSPSPVENIRMVLAVFRDVLAMIDERVADRLLRVGSARPKLGQPVDDVLHQVEAIKVIEHAHVEGRRGGAFFLIAAHVQIDMIGA